MDHPLSNVKSEIDTMDHLLTSVKSEVDTMDHPLSNIVKSEVDALNHPLFSVKSEVDTRDCPLSSVKSKADTMDCPLSRVKSEPLVEYEDDTLVHDMITVTMVRRETDTQACFSDTQACFSHGNIPHGHPENTTDQDIKQELTNFEWEYSAPASSINHSVPASPVDPTDNQHDQWEPPAKTIKLEEDASDKSLSDTYAHEFKVEKHKEEELDTRCEQSSTEVPRPVALYHNRTADEEINDEKVDNPAGTGNPIFSSNNSRLSWRCPSNKQNKCYICSYSSACKDTLLLHMRRHTEEEPYTCSECEFRCAYSRALTEHMRTHTGEKPYQCTQCDTKFADRFRYDRHMRKHTFGKPLVCEQCGYKSANTNDFLKHDKAHVNLQTSSYQCSDCGYKSADQSYFTPSSDQVGKKARKKTDKKTYKCLFCSYRST